MLDEILSVAKTFTQQTPVNLIRELLQQVVVAGLDPLQVNQVVQVLKQQTKQPLSALRDTLEELRKRSGAPPELDDDLAEITKRYIFIKSINAFWDRELRTVISIDGVRNAHWSDMPLKDDAPREPMPVLLGGVLGPEYVVDKADIMFFLPGSDELLCEGNSAKLNIWAPPTLLPVEGDVQPFLEHLIYLFDGDAQPIEWFLNWLAHLVQRPEIKQFTAVLLIGEAGIGKSIISKMICPLLGEANTATIEGHNLISQFNEWIDGAELVIVNELMMVDRLEAMERLKSYITDPWVMINRKNISTYKYANRANFLMFSNHRNAARIEKGDRRYFVWTSSAKPNSDQYYIDLMKWFDTGGDAALLYFLKQRDLSRFNPMSPPLFTEHKNAAIESSRSSAEAYLQEAFDTKTAPFKHDLVIINEIVDFLNMERHLRVNHKIVSAFLNSIGAVNLGKKRIYYSDDDKRRPRVWAIRNGPEWELVDEGDIRTAWRDIGENPISEGERNRILGILSLVGDC